jgi:hypothetical protein
MGGATGLALYLDKAYGLLRDIFWGQSKILTKSS